MLKDVDIAWLAGIIDGEGCFSIKRPIPKRKTPHRKTSYQVWVVLCNTSESMVRRAESILKDMGVEHQPIRRVWKGQRATRWQFWLHVARKHDVLRMTEMLLPHLTAKKTEAEIVQWYLSKSCRVAQYRTTELDALVLDSMSAIKRNGGEAPAEVLSILREVIPSQASPGLPKGEGLEGVETRPVRLNDNPVQECPTSSVH